MEHIFVVELITAEKKQFGLALMQVVLIPRGN